MSEIRESYPAIIRHQPDSLRKHIIIKITKETLMKITVAGVGYVGLSLAVLLAQNHEVTAITTTPAKANKLNKFISPIQDEEIERFFREVNAGERTLHLHTTVDKEAAYSSADLVIIAMNV
jgi:UDPglucose 6-dehydrogenase